MAGFQVRGKSNFMFHFSLDLKLCITEAHFSNVEVFQTN